MIKGAIIGLLAAASQDPFEGIPTYLSHASGAALMAVIIIGALREWWVTGKQYNRVVKERDDLLQMALRQVDTQERALAIAELMKDDHVQKA